MYLYIYICIYIYIYILYIHVIRYIYEYMYIYALCYIYMTVVLIFRDLSALCICRAPHSLFIQMLSGMRLTPNFSKCCSKKENNTVSWSNFLIFQTIDFYVL